MSAQRVDFDRRPWDPDRELDSVYERRASVIEAFDRFCEEAGISDDRAQQILMILYDYQENKRLINEDILADSPYRSNLELERRMSRLQYLVQAGDSAGDRSDPADPGVSDCAG